MKRVFQTRPDWFEVGIRPAIRRRTAIGFAVIAARAAWCTYTEASGPLSADRRAESGQILRSGGLRCYINLGFRLTCRRYQSKKLVPRRGPAFLIPPVLDHQRAVSTSPPRHAAFKPVPPECFGWQTFRIQDEARARR